MESLEFEKVREGTCYIFIFSCPYYFRILWTHSYGYNYDDDDDDDVCVCVEEYHILWTEKDNGSEGEGMEMKRRSRSSFFPH